MTSWLDNEKITDEVKLAMDRLENALLSQKGPRTNFLKIFPKSGVGIELGVARGIHSRQILEKTDPSFLYSVDAYAGDRNHDVRQYKLALNFLDRYRTKNSLLRMRFDEAVDFFPDAYFDFIYVDGYAHTGEEEGRTFTDWYPKLKPGGLLCGDDYHESWPKVVEEVDRFARNHKLKVLVYHTTDHFTSWAVFKPHANPEYIKLILEQARESFLN